MFRRWAAWPRSIRWLAGITVAVLTLAAIWAILVPGPDWFAHHDVGSATGLLHETALDNARGRLLTLGAGLAALVALVFTARTFYLSREGQVTDRYTKAVEQLGSRELDVRIGGIYALERIARDSARDHPTVMEVLTAFIREYSQEQWPRPGLDGAVPERSPRPDVQAALTVVGRRDIGRDARSIDLAGANLADARLIAAQLHSADLKYARLTGADLNFAYLRGAYLTGANLTGAEIAMADLAAARLTGASLPGALLSETDLTGADLTDAHLPGACLPMAHLSWAHLGGANLGRAYLGGADLRRADFTRANLCGANLRDADLAGADLAGANLARANLRGAKWPVDAPVPEGWKLDTGSGRLVAADTGAEPEAADTGAAR